MKMENQYFKGAQGSRVSKSDPQGVPQGSKVTLKAQLKVRESGNGQKWPKLLKNDQKNVATLAFFSFKGGSTWKC